MPSVLTSSQPFKLKKYEFSARMDRAILMSSWRIFMQKLVSWLRRTFYENELIQELFLNGERYTVALNRDGNYLDIAASHQLNESELYDSLQDLAFKQGSRLDPMYPMAGGDITFDDPYLTLRWHVILPPLSRDGPVACFRRMSFESFQLRDFLSNDTQKVMAQMDEMMSTGSPIFIAGQTGCGKTSLLSTLLTTYCSTERLIIIEELAELTKLSKRWIRLLARGPNIEGRGEVSLSTLINESLRLHPDRIVIGEVRQQGGRSLYRSMQTISAGVLSTIHAIHPHFLIKRLSEISDLSMDTWTEMFAATQPYYLQMQRKNPRLTEVFRFNPDKMAFDVIFSCVRTSKIQTF